MGRCEGEKRKEGRGRGEKVAPFSLFFSSFNRRFRLPEENACTVGYRGYFVTSKIDF